MFESPNPEQQQVLERMRTAGPSLLLREARRGEQRGFPGGSVAKNLPAVQQPRGQSLGWEDPLEKETSGILPMERGAWGATVHGVTKESDIA